MIKLYAIIVLALCSSAICADTFVTLGVSHDYVTQYTESKADLYQDTCLDIEYLHCGIELKNIRDPFGGDTYNSATIYIEKTFKVSK